MEIKKKKSQNEEEVKQNKTGRVKEKKMSKRFGGKKANIYNKFYEIIFQISITYQSKQVKNTYRWVISDFNHQNACRLHKELTMMTTTTTTTTTLLMIVRLAIHFHISKIWSWGTSHSLYLSHYFIHSTFSNSVCSRLTIHSFTCLHKYSVIHFIHSFFSFIPSFISFIFIHCYCIADTWFYHSLWIQITFSFSLAQVDFKAIVIMIHKL